MTRAHRLLAAAVFAACAWGALAQDKPPPDPAAAAGKAQSAPQDLEPSVNTSAAPADGDSHPQAAPQPASAPAPSSVKKTPKSTASAADAKGKGNAKDRIELDPTQITGNRELPKVLYIVPWKSSDLSDLAGRPANSLLDEVLTPVDRDVFQRENRYYRALQPDEPRPGGRAQGAPAAAGAAPEAAAAPPVRDEK
jgi:hypothetical protein